MNAKVFWISVAAGVVSAILAGYLVKNVRSLNRLVS